jgi:hypothetical protein
MRPPTNVVEYPAYILYGLCSKYPWNIKLTVKVNLSLCLTKYHDMRTYGGVEVYLLYFLASLIDGGEWSASPIGPLSPRKEQLVPIGQESPWNDRMENMG